MIDHKAYRQGGNHNTAEHETLRKIQHDAVSKRRSIIYFIVRESLGISKRGE